MYDRPQLKRFGSLRELTLAGFDGDSDGWYLRIAPSVTGCNLYSATTCS